jgi:hypothetical protein
LRAYKADWTHFAAWCAANGFIPAPATVGAAGDLRSEQNAGRRDRALLLFAFAGALRRSELTFLRDG